MNASRIRRLEVTTGILLVLVVALLTLAARPPRSVEPMDHTFRALTLAKPTSQQLEVLQVQELQIVNKFGTIVGAIGTDEAGNGALLLTQADGTLQMSSTLNPLGVGTLATYTNDGEVAFWATSDTIGNGFVQLSDVNGLPMIQMVKQFGGGTFGLVDDGGNFEAFLGHASDSPGATLNVFHDSGNKVAGIGINVEGNGTLELFNSDGSRTHFAGSGPNASPVYQTHRADDTLVWSSGNDGGSQGGESLLGDLDADNDVDFEDFLVFAANFGSRL